MLSIQHIAQALQDAGHTQVELEALTGVPQPVLSRWSSGEVPPAGERVLRLIAAYQALVGPLDLSPLGPTDDDLAALQQRAQTRAQRLAVDASAAAASAAAVAEALRRRAAAGDSAGRGVAAQAG
jgi:transcriptional regulator with XRE-family HTH domain